jgi:glyoxylase-like metal-dependent hydrolase (beta-lactamase superfamily II)
MGKRIAVFLACLLSAAPLALAQRRPIDWAKVEVKTQKLADNMYLIQFVGTEPRQIAGSNVGVLVTPDGIILADAGFAVLSARLNDALKMISDKPVKYVINTHWHGDHAGGDVFFDKTATIIAQDNARKRMEKGNVGNPNTTIGALPLLTFDDHLTLRTAVGDVQILHMPGGHTDTDCVVLFPDAKVVMMGDDFGTMGGLGFPGAMDQDQDGTGGIMGIIAAADYAVVHAPDDAKIVPGHGDLATKADLTKYLAMLKGATAAVQMGIAQGKSAADLKQAKILAPWSSFGDDARQGAFIDRLYKILSQSGSAKSSSGAQ